jgi:hypothetical protein
LLIEIKIPPFNANGKKLTTRASYLASETQVNNEFGEMAERLKALPC